MLENSADLPNVTTLLLQEFNAFCIANDLIGKAQADHIGLRCSSREKYEFQRCLFEHDSRFVYQSIISQRRISIIGLSSGLETVVGPLNYLELSDQKPDGSQKDLVDHLEIVPTGCSYEELVSHMKAKGVVMKEIIRPHHTTYDVVLPSGFNIKLSQEFLVDKIKRDEMQ